MGVLFGWAFAIVGLYGLLRSIHLRRRGIGTIETVTETKISKVAGSVVVQFKTANKRKAVLHVGGCGVIGAAYAIGTAVPVLYDPHNPTNAVVKDFGMMWLMPLGFIATGLFFAYMSFTH